MHLLGFFVWVLGRETKTREGSSKKKNKKARAKAADFFQDEEPAAPYTTSEGSPEIVSIHDSSESEHPSSDSSTSSYTSTKGEKVERRRVTFATRQTTHSRPRSSSAPDHHRSSSSTSPGEGNSLSALFQILEEKQATTNGGGESNQAFAGKDVRELFKLHDEWNDRIVQGQRDAWARATQDSGQHDGKSTTKPKKKKTTKTKKPKTKTKNDKDKDTGFWTPTHGSWSGDNNGRDDSGGGKKQDSFNPN